MKFIKYAKIRPNFLSIVFITACMSAPQQGDFDKWQAAKARTDLAVGYLNQQDFAQAKLNLDKALNYAPDYYLVHSAFAYFYQQQGLVEQANQAYLNAIELDKKQGDVRNNYGVFLCGQGKFEDAYHQFQQALKTPNYYHQTDTIENIAICAYTQNNLVIYQENLNLLEKLAPERAVQLKSAVK